RIQAGENAVAALTNRNPGASRLHADDVYEPRRVRGVSAIWRCGEARRLGTRRLRPRDETLIRHQRQNDVAPLPNPIGIFERIVERRTFWHRSQGCSLGERQSRRAFSEVVASGALHSIPAVAERNLIQVRFEYLILGV